jgi:hypothetical protein
VALNCAKLITSIINKLLDWHGDLVWTESTPSGLEEAYRLLGLTRKLNLCIFDFQMLAHLKNSKAFKQIDFQFKNIGEINQKEFEKKIKNQGRKRLV